jgi:hypothetical protein
MFICLYCNLESTNERAQICQNCGPSKKWLPAEVDQSDGLRKYYAAAREFIFDPDISDDMFESQSGKLREKFKISYTTNSNIVGSLKKKRDAISALNKFKLEFDENVMDAYAGQDTLLRFRFTNQSDNELLKVHLHWDDPDTPDDLDFNVRSINYVKPKQPSILAGNHVFTRFGFKEIGDMQAIISDPEQKNAKFVVSPFNFKIGNATQTVINNTTNNTTQNISIEGRGIVDASGTGAEKGQNPSEQTTNPVWKPLSVTYQPNEDNDFIESLINSLRAAEEGASDSVDKKKASLNTTLRDEVESLFYGLKDFNDLLSQKEVNRIVPASEISLHLLGVFHFEDLESELDNLIGVAFENPQKVVLDSENFIDNFVGEATLITTTGLTILNSLDNLVDWTISYSWNQLKPNGLCFYRQRFGPGAYLISFGDESFKANVPGLKFDLRRYQGIEPIELKYDKIDQTLSNILLLAPEAADIAPRLNDESTHVETPVLEEPTLASGSSIKDAVTEFTSSIENLRHYDDDALEDECKQFTADFISDQLKEVISTVVPGCSVLDIHGIMIEDPDGNYIDSDSDVLQNFSGSASVFTVHGLSAIACIDNLISFESQVSWAEAENCGLRIWADTDGDGQFICLGLNNIDNFTHLYGCRWAVNNFELADYAFAVGSARQALSRVYDLASGRGELASPESQGQVLSDGSIYNGQFDQNSKCTGYASYSWFSGDRYTGEFLNGQYSGQGEYQFADGRHYTGSWVNGLKNGYGVFSFANGDVYEGEFMNDLCHGDGQYTFPNGDFYTGNYADGRYDGIGTFTWANGTEYTGEWSVGVKHGRGLITFPDGQTQEGTWDNDVYQEVKNSGKQSLVSSLKEGFKKGYKSTSGEDYK